MYLERKEEQKHEAVWVIGQREAFCRQIMQNLLVRRKKLILKDTVVAENSCSLSECLIRQPTRIMKRS